MKKLRALLLAFCIVASWLIGLSLLIGYMGEAGARLWILLTILGFVIWIISLPIEEWLDRKNDPSRRF